MSEKKQETKKFLAFLYSRKVLLVGGLSVLDKYGES